MKIVNAVENQDGLKELVLYPSDFLKNFDKGAVETPCKNILDITVSLIMQVIRSFPTEPNWIIAIRRDRTGMIANGQANP